MFALVMSIYIKQVLPFHQMVFIVLRKGIDTCRKEKEGIQGKSKHLQIENDRHRHRLHIVVSTSDMRISWQVVLPRRRLEFCQCSRYSKLPGWRYFHNKMLVEILDPEGGLIRQR